MSRQTHHPQRLAQATAPGSLLKRAEAFNVRHKLERAKELAGHDPEYLAEVRKCPCLKCGMDPCGEAAHVRFSSGAFNKRGGMGKRPPDKWALPLCPDCHTRDKDSQHRIGELQFWHDVGLSPLLLCQKLYAAKGDIVRMRAVVFAAIGERG